MHFHRADTHTNQNASKAAAVNGGGRTGVSMPAVPVLQQKPVQKMEGEQQENQSETDGQALHLREVAFAGEGVVQREVHNDKVNDPDSIEGQKAIEFINSVNDKAQEAYQYALTVPSLGAYSGIDGYTALWKYKWDTYVAGGTPALMAATFGYVVESLVSHELGPYKPVSPSGCTIYYQVTVGGTRPDLVLKYNGADIVWVDLTSDGSVDHIFNKDNWDAKVARYAEVSYPALDPGSLAFMRQNKDNTGELSAEEFEAKKSAAQEAYALKKAQWKAVGLKYRYGNAKAGIGQSAENLALNPHLKRDYIRALLSHDTGVAIEEKLMPSILIAMGVNPGPWGFNLGYSQSEKVGDAWLTDHDVAAPPEEVQEVAEDNSDDDAEPVAVDEGNDHGGELIPEEGPQ